MDKFERMQEKRFFCEILKSDGTEYPEDDWKNIGHSFDAKSELAAKKIATNWCESGYIKQESKIAPFESTWKYDSLIEKWDRETKIGILQLYDNQTFTED